MPGYLLASDLTPLPGLFLLYSSEIITCMVGKDCQCIGTPSPLSIGIIELGGNSR